MLILVDMAPISSSSTTGNVQDQKVLLNHECDRTVIDELVNKLNDLEDLRYNKDKQNAIIQAVCGKNI